MRIVCEFKQAVHGRRLYFTYCNSSDAHLRLSVVSSRRCPKPQSNFQGRGWFWVAAPQHGLTVFQVRIFHLFLGVLIDPWSITELHFLMSFLFRKFVSNGEAETTLRAKCVFVCLLTIRCWPVDMLTQTGTKVPVRQPTPSPCHLLWVSPSPYAS